MLTSNRLSPNEPLGAGIGDTVYYEPVNDVLIHYRAHRYLAIRALAAETSSGFAQFATGIKEQLGREGTWRDAEDGELSGNPWPLPTANGRNPSSSSVRSEPRRCSRSGAVPAAPTGREGRAVPEIPPTGSVKPTPWPRRDRIVTAVVTGL